jgi:hypothetical protein
MRTFTRISRFFVVATLAVVASLGLTTCGPDYAIFSVHVTAAKPTNNLASCRMTITDEGGKAVLYEFPLSQQYGGTDSAGNPTLRQGCGGGLTPASGNIGTFSYSTSRSGGTLTFKVEGYDDGNKVVQSGASSAINVAAYPPIIQVEVMMSLTTP